MVKWGIRIHLPTLFFVFINLKNYPLKTGIQRHCHICDCVSFIESLVQQQFIESPYMLSTKLGIGDMVGSRK